MSFDWKLHIISRPKYVITTENLQISTIPSMDCKLVLFLSLWQESGNKHLETLIIIWYCCNIQTCDQ